MSEQNESSITVLEQQVARLVLQVNLQERKLVEYETKTNCIVDSHAAQFRIIDRRIRELNKSTY